MPSKTTQRLLEILPGALSWGTLILMVVLSARFPVFVAYFIILFDIYWLLKTIYLFIHLRLTFVRMRENLRIDWARRLEEVGSVDPRGHVHEWRDLYHLVIFPMYKEPYSLVRESIMCVKNASYPKERLMVVLATEARAGIEAKEIAQKIEEEFGGAFFKFLVTTHPVGLQGEIPGKGSNEAWAGTEAKRLLVDALGIPYNHVLVSVFDVDTQVPKGYFARLSYVFLTSPNPYRAIYQPVPFYFNNIFEARAFSRVGSFSSTFWQMMQQGRPERLESFSSQSIPLTALVDFGFWERNVVSEDSRSFWQGYLQYHGDFRVVPLLYPVSLDANTGGSLWDSIQNLYRQQRRWGWGAENIPYLLYRFAKKPEIPLRKRLYWSWHMLEGFHSWATNSLMIFALGWLPVVLGGAAFNATILSYNLPKVTSFIVNLTMFGVATSAILAVALLPAKPVWFRKRHYFLYFLEWLLVPVTLIVFGAFPALDAQTRLMLGGRFRLGFWVTPKGRNPKAEKEVGEKV